MTAKDSFSPTGDGKAALLQASPSLAEGSSCHRHLVRALCSQPTAAACGQRWGKRPRQAGHRWQAGAAQRLAQMLGEGHLSRLATVGFKPAFPPRP